VILLVACTSQLAPGPAPTEDPRGAWETSLQAAVQDDGFVDYESLRSDPAPLDRYVAWLAQPQELSGDELFAHRINAYNAFTLAGVLDNWPLESVRDVRVGLLGFGGAGFFTGLRFKLDGTWTSLKALEDDQLRATFDDPRVHGAINCASAGCPPLRDGLFTAEGLDSELDEAMTRFVETRVRLDGDEAVFSEIFDWFEDDFRLDTPCHYAAQYDETYAALAEADCPHRFEPYDWSLNAASSPQR